MDLLKLLRGFVNVFLCIAFAAGGRGLPQTGCDGYVRVSAGYLQVMGSTRTPPD